MFTVNTFAEIVYWFKQDTTTLSLQEENGWLFRDNKMEAHD